MTRIVLIRIRKGVENRGRKNLLVRYSRGEGEVSRKLQNERVKGGKNGST